MSSFPMKEDKKKRDSVRKSSPFHEGFQTFLAYSEQIDLSSSVF